MTWPSVFSSPSQPDPARVDRFRNLHNVGEEISGFFLRWETSGLGWVDFQGIALLAGMASQPEPGAELFFRVKQLYPKIILQELLSRNLLQSLTILERFRAAQIRLETDLAAVWPSRDPGHLNFQERIRLYDDLCARRPQLLASHTQLQAMLHEINEELVSRGAGRYFVLPWLIDHVQCAGLLFDSPAGSARHDPLRVHFTCIHPALGQMEIHIDLSHKKLAWTLHSEQSIPRSSLAACLRQYAPLQKLKDARFLGTHPLPKGSHAGILARKLLAPGPNRFRLHLQV